METSEQCVKSAQSEQQRHHNDFIDVFIVNFEQIRENAGQRKPLFWNILHSDLSGFANLSANNFIYI